MYNYLVSENKIKLDFAISINNRKLIINMLFLVCLIDINKYWEYYIILL